MASNLNPANAVTASRFLTLPPFLWAVDAGRYQVAAVLVAVCAVLDLFDGAVARAFHCTTAFGEVFDAIADGFCYGFFLLVMVSYGWVPWPPVVAIVALGVVNFALRTVYARRAGRTVNYRSFAMERLVGYAAYLGGFGATGFQVGFYFWSFTAALVVVLVHDAKRMLLDPVDPPETDAATSNRAADVARRSSLSVETA